MISHRFDARPRWLWPATWTTAIVLLAGLLALPEAWWEAVWPDGVLRPRDGGEAATGPLRLVEVEVVRRRPPLQVVPRDRPGRDRPGPRPDPRWWTEGWRARIAADLGAGSPAVADSSALEPLRLLWGAEATVERILAEPDTVLQRRLWWLVEEQALARDDIDGVFSAIARARAYVDLKRREAAMFDEFGPEQIRVPD